MNEKSDIPNNVLSKKDRSRLRLLFLFLILMIFFGARIVTIESPDNWIEAEVTLTDVRHISRKPNLWKIADTEGNTYSMYESDEFMEQIHPQTTYQIMYSPGNNNNIRAMTQGDRVIIDYAHSVSVYCERSIWEWILGSGGFAGGIAMAVSIVLELREKFKQEKTNQKTSDRQ